ncbi:hypothetical protein [Pontibacter liquoris]|uniref:hypothetical protein n=1 Tax=Pontibacter liquoris TaxID=2905677 RepID=UPI001FA7DE59|nr:hypothetical protein [Pontibacter liquoris]
MKHLLSERLASYGLVTILLLFVLFHGLVLLRILPNEMVWGGGMTDQKQMITLELLALLVSLLMLAVVGIKAGFIPVKVKPVLLKGALWVMCGMFLLNTLGNMTSQHALEKFAFTPLTLLLSLFCCRLAVARKKPEHETIKVS